MSLQGSLETFALPDVLTLLASTAKSGELRVTGAGTDGRVWLAGGELVASEAGQAVDPTDVFFELLRLDGGTFIFTEAELDDRGSSEPIQPVLEQATERLEAWRAIAAVVPSMAVTTALSPDLRGPSVTLSAERWRAIVAVSSARTVADVAYQLALGEFDACRLVKELVDDGLVLVTVPEPVVLEEAADEAVGEQVEAQVEEQVEPEPKPQHGQEGEPVNVGEPQPEPRGKSQKHGIRP